MSVSSPTSRPQADSHATGYLLLLALGLCWGVNWPAMKLSVGVMPVWDFRAACLTFGAAMTLLLARAYGASLHVPRRELLPLFLCATFSIAGWQILTAYALTLMDAGRASILAFTMPLWASIFSIFLLNERLNTYRAVGLVLGLTGLALLVVPEFHSIAAAPLGVAAILGAALSWAFGTVLMKRFTWSLSAAALSGWQLLIAAGFAILGALLFDGDRPWADDWSLSEISGVVYAVTVSIAFGHWAWFRIVRIFPAPIAAIGTMLVPVVGVFSSALLLGEAIGINELVALVLVTSGLFCVLVLPGLRAGR
ncbi:MAG TPA: DMT family transporter [Kiloniellales bacterium]|nr:DMT family transporter [Kiloniellales bacterium]